MNSNARRLGPKGVSLSMLVLLAAAWFARDLFDVDLFRGPADGERRTVERQPAQNGHRGSGAVSVTKSTDLSKPGGGVISEDDSWKAGLEKGETVGYAADGAKPQRKEPVRTGATRTSFAAFRDGQWVTGVGEVVRVLDDDLDPPRHQRFIMKDGFGNTVLVAHNIDQAARIPGLKAGDEIAFKGEFRVNDRGGVIHWTHPDSSRRHPGGWLRRN